MKQAAFGLVSVVVTAMPVFAADLNISVMDQDGSKVRNAVVSLTPQFAMSSAPVSQIKPEMRQQGTLFSPFVLPVTKGATVTFPNFDEFRHQVYSFSKAKRFELRLYGQDESKSIQFDQAGVVALGCNIHDNMLAYIYVSDAPIVVKTNPRGEAAFTGLEAGDYAIQVWHPDVKHGDAPRIEPISVAEGQVNSVAATVTLRSIRSVQKSPAEGDYN